MSLRRLLLLLTALAIAAPAFAASISERSPFTQGHWWNPTRGGSGFDVLSIRDQAFVVWFTYDAAGKPTWYTASGQLNSAGNAAWPLLQHRWVGSGIAASTAVGSLRLTVQNAESLAIDWNIGGLSGSTVVQPLSLSGVGSEVDHTGSWFAPANSGWGLSVTEQGDFVGGVLFTYDSTGAPTWVAGMSRGSGTTVELQAFTGSCPACAYVPSTSRSVGRLTFHFAGEAEMSLESGPDIAMAPGVEVDGARLVQLGRPASWRPADRQLAAFDTADALKTYLGAGLLNVRPVSSGLSFSASPPAVPYSPTNLQESGVDEADIVKSDGRFVYTYAYDGFGVRQSALRVAEVDNQGATLAIRGSVPLVTPNPVGSAGLYLLADKLVSVASTQPAVYPGVSPWVLPGAWMNGTTYVEVLATSQTALPAPRWRAQIDGHLVTSRRIGDRLYLVTRFVPDLPGFIYGTTDPPAAAANQALLATTPVGSLLPKVSIDEGAPMPLVAPTDVYLPPQGTRPAVADLIVVTAIDLAVPAVAQSIAITGSVDTVYASPASLYLASSRAALRDSLGVLSPSLPPFLLTDIHRISLDPKAMKIVGSGSVEGAVAASNPDMAPFRLSEHQDMLRVVTSSQSMWGGAWNRLTILAPSVQAPGVLKTLAYLPNPQRPQTLGKPNEVLYGTRFIADRLYAVTFLTIDPLYVVDLANPSDPRITGALQVPGFADYLHPLPNGLLLGFGKEARPATGMGDGQFAWYQGLQITLFAIDADARPRELQRLVFGKRGSDSALLRDHHAFSALMRGDGSGSFAIPASIHDGVPTFYNGDATYYPWLESGLLRLELVGSTASDARLVQTPSLVTHRVPQPMTSDAAITSARSVLFPAGVIYVENGRFWKQDSAGNTTGPF